MSKKEQSSFEDYIKEHYEYIVEEDAVAADPNAAPPAADPNAVDPNAAPVEEVPAEEPPPEEAQPDQAEEAIGYVMSIVPQTGDAIQAQVYKIGDELDKVIDENKKVWKLKIPNTLDADTNYPGAFIARSDAGIGVILLKNI